MLSVVLLRRINVTGGHVRMAELVETFARAGYPNATSVRASGNVIVECDEPVDSAAIAYAVAEVHGFATECSVRTGSELARVADASPFAGADAKIEVIFMHRALTHESVEALAAVATGPDELVAIGREIHWMRPLPLGQSIPNETNLEQVIGGNSTRRTMGTVERIPATMEQLG